ncbi:MAG TPA: hypothetical protein VFR62_13710 [Gemmatimonadales bacterium]|nr:hypothetical protein [Gemmatimonadales bacterium]
MIKSTAGQAAVLAGGLLCAAAPANGQDVAADSSAQAYAPSDVAVSSETGEDQAKVLQVVSSIVLPARTDDDLGRAIEAADQALNRADVELASAAERRKEAEELVRSRELRLNQIDAVRRRKDETLSQSRRDSLEAEERALRRRLPLTKDLVALANIEIDLARAAREAAIAEQQALESERMLVRQRAERDGDPARVLDLGREALLAQKKSAGLARRVAAKRELVSSKRLDLYRAYQDVRLKEGS